MSAIKQSRDPFCPHGALALLLPLMACSAAGSESEEEVPAAQEAPVVNGKKVGDGELNQLAALIYAPDGKLPADSVGSALNHQFCTATVLSDRWVLTAAHCVRSGRASESVEIQLPSGSLHEGTPARPVNYGYNGGDFVYPDGKVEVVDAGRAVPGEAREVCDRIKAEELDVRGKVVAVAIDWNVLCTYAVAALAKRKGALGVLWQDTTLAKYEGGQAVRSRPYYPKRDEPYDGPSAPPTSFFEVEVTGATLKDVIEAKQVRIVGRYTAAPTFVSVAYGSHDLSGERLKLARLQRIVVHPKANMTTLDFDVALLKTEAPLDGAEATLLPPARSPAELGRTGAEVVAAGWGIGPRRTADNAFKAKLTLISDAECQRLDLQTDPRSNLQLGSVRCAVPELGGPCFGDSGGPLIQAIDGKKYQIGIFSWLNGLRRNQHGDLVPQYCDAPIAAHYGFVDLTENSIRQWIRDTSDL